MESIKSIPWSIMLGGLKMSKINIKLMSDVTFATLKKNINKYADNFVKNPSDGSWINEITSEAAFEIKKYQIDDFELKIPKNYQDRTTDLENAIVLYEHLNVLPNYILSEPRFWLWIMFEKGYETSLAGMEKIDATSFKHQWLFTDGLRRGLFFGILSRLFYRVALTYSPENVDDPYYLTRYVMENPTRFREISWRTISNQQFVVKAMLRAEMRANIDIEFEEKGAYFSSLAKEICKLGSIKFIDAMDDKDLEDYIYQKYVSIIEADLERQKIDKYNLAIDLMNSDEAKKVNRAAILFRELNGFMDSANMEEICKEKQKQMKRRKGLFGLLKSKK